MTRDANAQNRTPAATPREVLTRFHLAMKDQDADALADLYAPDGFHEFAFFTPNRPPRYTNREEVRAGYRDAWRDHPLDIESISDVFVTEANDPEVITGQWRMAARVRATGQPVVLTGLLWLRVHNGTIVHCRDFMDGLGIVHALGRGPFARDTPAGTAPT